MTKTVPLILFDPDGSIFHAYDAEVVTETPDVIVVKVLDQDGEEHLETYSRIDGQCLDHCFPLVPQYVMMAAKSPLKNSFAHLPESWWQP